jgi:chromosome partitioning protein
MRAVVVGCAPQACKEAYKRACLFACMLIALANSKGGVGKSTISVHLAVLAHERGRKVALIDADAQESSSRWVKDLGSPFPAHRLQTPDDVIERADEIAHGFDVVIADGPAGLSEVTRALLMVADLALLPCGPSALDLRALQEALRVVRQAHKIRRGSPKACVIPNKLQTGYRLSRELLDAAGRLSVPCLDALKLRQAYADAAGQGSVVWRLPRAEEATQEFQRLYDQISDHEKEIPR